MQVATNTKNPHQPRNLLLRQDGMQRAALCLAPMRHAAIALEETTLRISPFVHNTGEKMK
jgi:hypothetical protein